MLSCFFSFLQHNETISLLHVLNKKAAPTGTASFYLK